MQIIDYDIELTTLKEDNLNLIREWRNMDHIRFYMEYDKEISMQEQVNWFNNLLVTNNLYFVINVKSKSIGLIHLKDINWNTKEAEAGIFIGDKEYLNTNTSILATITINDFAFNVLQLRKLKAKIKNDNQKAISFNLALGYLRNLENKNNSNFSYYVLLQSDYNNNLLKLRNTLEKMRNHKPSLILSKSELDLFVQNRNFINQYEIKFT